MPRLTHWWRLELASNQESLGIIRNSIVLAASVTVHWLAEIRSLNKGGWLRQGFWFSIAQGSMYRWWLGRVGA